MRDKHYKVRHIRLSDEVWEELKEKRRKSKKTWNLFLKGKTYGNNEKNSL